MKTLHNLTNEDLAWIDDAMGYGNVSSIGAAYRRLIKFRELIIAGGYVGICSQSPGNFFDTTQTFDDWVRRRYPDFADDIIHPTFMTSQAERGGGENSAVLPASY